MRRRASSPNHATWALLLGLALLVGCPASMLDDDDSAFDDDDLADDDDAADDDDVGDDDSATDDDDAITAVTFAAMLDGSAYEPPFDGKGWITEFQGVFQFIYWTSLEGQDLNCRQRFSFGAIAHFGEALPTPCGDCVGSVAVTSVQALDPTGYDDGCTELPPDVDLSFLLTQEDITVPSDFRTLTLLSVDMLLESDWTLSVSGLTPTELVQQYAMAGLEIRHVAFISPTGWLHGEAALDEVASSWDGAGWLPMFVIYVDADGGVGATLTGESFLSTLWTVRVGAGLGAEELP
jgi:hypothetical protein